MSGSWPSQVSGGARCQSGQPERGGLVTLFWDRQEQLANFGVPPNPQPQSSGGAELNPTRNEKSS